VFNLVSGSGSDVGEAVASHREVDMVSFTGSTRTGRRVAELAAATAKRVTLELGGKSATVILPDADFDRAVTAGVAMCLLNSGQTCSALTRMLVPRDRLSESRRSPRGLPSPTRPATLSSTRHVSARLSRQPNGTVCARTSSKGSKKARSSSRRGRRPGRPGEGLFRPPDGFLGGPARHDDRPGGDLRAGPVDPPYDTEDEAIEIANDSIYGLAGAVWGADERSAVEVARRIRTGQVDINGGGFNPLAPFGGFKQSGHGRELGKFGLEEYLETKSLQL